MKKTFTILSTLACCLLISSGLMVNSVYGQSPQTESPSAVTSSIVTNPTYAYADDVNYAEFDDDASTATYSAFGFTLPVTTPVSQVLGIEVLLTGYTEGRLLTVRLSKDGTTPSPTSYSGVDLGAGSTQTVGNPTELWGLSWTVGEVNSTSFSVIIDAEVAADIAYLDHVQVRVYYCTPPQATVVTNPYILPNTAGLCSRIVTKTDLLANITYSGEPEPSTTSITFALTAPNYDQPPFSQNVNATFSWNYTINNGCSPPSGGSFNVTVVDTEDPVITDCPVTINITGCSTTDITGIPAYSATLATSSYGVFSDATNQGVATDNCGITIVRYQDSQSGTCPVVVTRVWTVIDAAGNTDTCTQTITISAPDLIVDEASPVSLGTCNTLETIAVALDDWFAGFSFIGGCNVSETFSWDIDRTEEFVRADIDVAFLNDLADDLRCGGSITVYYNVYSQCESLRQVSSTFTVTTDVAPTLSAYEANKTANLPFTACEVQVAWNTVSVNDECTIVSFTMTVDPPSVVVTVGDTETWGQFPPGVTTITYYAIDVCGREVEHSFTVTVTDIHDPVLIGGHADDIDVGMDTGECFATVSWNAPVVTDNCLVLLEKTIVVEYAGAGTESFAFTDNISYTRAFPLGTSTVTFIVSDNDNTVTRQFNVTVTDNQPPMVYCPTPTNPYEVAAGTCSWTLTLTATATDNCPGTPTIEYSYAGGAYVLTDTYTYPVGTTTVIVLATDVNGVTNTCSYDVVVVDTTVPEVLVVASPLILDLPDTAPVEVPITIGMIDAGSNDPCGIDAMSLSKDLFTCADVGDHEVILTVTDTYGNVATGSVTVTIRDVTDPEVTCPTVDPIYYADADVCVATLTFTATATDNCGVDNIKYYINYGTGSQAEIIFPYAFPVGSTVVTVIATDDNGLTDDCTFTVNVVDNQPPTFTCPFPDESYPADFGECYARLDFTVTDEEDNCAVESIVYSVLGVTITYPYNFPVGTTTVNVLVTDVNTLTATCSFNVNVVDLQDPVISCNDIIPAVVSSDPGMCNDYVVIVLPVATDNCGIETYTLSAPVPVSVYQNPSEGNRWEAAGTFPLGTTTVTLTVWDINGRTASCTFTVKVNYTPAPGETPIANTQDITRSLNASGQVSITPVNVYLNPGSTIQSSCAWVSWSVYPNAFDCSDIGPNTVTLSVFLADGSLHTNTAVVTIEDNQTPVVTPQNIVVNLVTSTVTITADDVIAGIVDNCSILTKTLSQYTFDCEDVGTPVEVTISVTDQGGNTGYATAWVTVTDTTPPVAVTQDIEVELDEFTGTASITPAQINNGSTDNCSLASMTLDIDEFDCDDVGTPVVVTLTVYDVNGNSATETATVTVKDVTAPVVDCVTTTFTRNNTPSFCYYTVQGTEFDKTAIDVCDGTVLTITNTFNGSASLSGANIPVGPHVITWYFTDSSGNTSSCDITVTVTDNEPPVFTQFPTGKEASIGTACIDLYAWDRPVFEDNCTIDFASLNFSYVTNNTVYNNGIINFIYSGGDSNTYTSVSANFPVGITTVTYTAKDIYGNTVTETFTVKHTESAKPIVKTKPHTVVLDASGNGSMTADDINSPYDENSVPTNLDGTRDLCGNVFLSIVSDTFTCDDLGVNYVVLTVTDLSGNVQTGIAEVTVVDETAPTLVCVATSTLTRGADIGTCTYTVSADEFDPTTEWDACGIETLTYELTGATVIGPVVASTLAGVVFEKGLTTVTWRAVDGSLNDTECSFDVDVVDTQTPTIACAGPFTRPTIDGECEYETQGVEFDPTFGDNCPGATITNTYNSSASLAGAVFPKGTTVVTWTVTDGAGLQATCEVSITIIDEELPQIACVTDTFKDSTLDECGYVVVGPEFDPVVSDNCTVSGTLTVTNSFNAASTLAGALLPVGTTTITWFATDESGNTNSCTFSVTVTDVQKPWFTSFPLSETRNIAANSCFAVIDWVVPGVGDNCGILNQTYEWETNNSEVTEFIPGSTASYYIGVTTITWIVTDVNGLVHSQTFTVTVKNTRLPDVQTKPHIVYLDVNGDGSMTPDDINVPYEAGVYPNGTRDLCGDVFLAISTDTFTCADLGDNIVTLYVTNLSGNTSSATAIVTVLDQIQPELVCVTSTTLTVGTTTGTCTHVAANGEFDPTLVDDNCTVTTQTYTLSGVTEAGPVLAETLDGVPFNKGTTTVVWTAIDQSGNTSTCSFDVIVVDTEDPAIACVGNQTVDTDPGECTYTVVDSVFDPTLATDNCPDPVLSYELTGITTGSAVTNTLAGVVFNKGLTTVVWTITDGATNTATCSFTVLVEDNEKPTIACVTDTFRYTTKGLDGAIGVCGYGVIGTEFDPTVDDNCTVIASVTNTFNGGASLDGATLPVGITTITWYVTDGSGNMNECTIYVEVEDNELPRFTAFPPNVLRTLSQGNCDAVVIWDIPTPADNCAIGLVTYTWETNNPTTTDIYVQVVIENVRLQATFPAGITTVTYTVVDVNGNPYSQSFTVTVKDVSAPDVLTKNHTIYLNEFGVATIVPEDINSPYVAVTNPGGTRDDCGPVTLSVSTDTFTCAHLGENTVTLTVTDLAGNQTSAPAIVTVLDVISPEIVCVSSTTLTVGTTTGTCTHIAANGEFDPTLVDDNCTVTTQTYTLSGATEAGPMLAETLDGVAFNKGTTTVVWTAVDQSGNTSTCSFDVIVVDTEDPAIACVGNQTVDTDPGICTYTVVDDEFDTTQATDNCPDPVLSYELSGETVAAAVTNTLKGVIFNKGLTTVVWTITDGANNAVSCTFTVLVEDNEKPTIACATDTFVRDALGVDTCTYTAVDDEFDPDFDDNCPGTVITHNYAGYAPYTNTLDGAIFPIGYTDVVWTATDASGNWVTCTITIHVRDVDAPVWDYAWNIGGTRYCGEEITLFGCSPQFEWRRPTLSDLEDCTAVVITESISSSLVQDNVDEVYDPYNQNVGGVARANLTPGIYTFTYTATDAYNNTSSCYFVVRVVQVDAPAIANCPVDRLDIVGCTVYDIDNPVFSDVMALTDLATYLGNGGTINNQCTDNPSIAEVWYIDEIVSTDACPIEVERTWYLIDFIGRTVSCTQTIQVTEDVPPHLLVEGTLPGADLGNACMSEVPAAPTEAYIAALYGDNCPSATVTATLLGPTSENPMSSGDDCGWVVTYTFSVTDDCLNETMAYVVYRGADTGKPALVSATLTCAELDQEDLNWCYSAALAFNPVTLEALVADLYQDNCTLSPTARWVETIAATSNTDCGWTLDFVYRITDDCGNPTTCTVTYSGADSDAPYLAYSNITTASLNETLVNECLSVATAFVPASLEADVAGLYRDNCTASPTATYYATEAGSGNTDCGWIFTYTFVVSDACGNTVTPTVVRSGGDTEGPVVQNAEGFKTHYKCLLAVPEAPKIDEVVPAANETSLYVTDNCSDVIKVKLIESTIRQLGCPQTYILTRTWSVTDECLNETIFDQVITVLDDIAPELVNEEEDTETMLARFIDDECKSWIDTFDATTLQAAVAALYVDNCGTHTATLDATATVITGVDCSWKAVFTYIITDQCFNSVTATVTYTGGNQTPPSGTMPAAIVDRNACAADAEASYLFDAISAASGYLDNCGNPVTATLTNTELDGDDCGWIITYTFTVEDDCENKLANQYYTVSGRDQTAPTGDMPGAITSVPACFDEVGFTAAMFDAAHALANYSDNCGTVTATNVTSVKDGTDCNWTITYTFSVADVCGNTLTAQYYTISGSDQTDPVIHECPESLIQVTVSTGCDYEADDSWDVIATDNCTTTPELSYTLTGATNVGPVVATTLAGVTFKIGITTVTWTATDDCQNDVTCTFTVQITEGAPTFKEQLVENQEVDVDNSLSCTYTHSGIDWDPELYPSCVTLTLTWELTGATTESGSNTLDDVEFNVGVTTVTWTASDGVESATHIYTVTVRPVLLSGVVRYYNHNETSIDIPIEGAIVRLMSGSTPVPNGEATTLSDGSYLIGDKVAVQAADGIQVFVGLPHGGLSSGDAYAIRLRVSGTYPSFWGPAGTPDYVKFIDRVAAVHVKNGIDPIVPTIASALQVFQRHTGNLAFFNAGDWAFMSEHDNVLFSYIADDTGYRSFDQDVCTMNIAVRPYGDVRGTYPFSRLKSYLPVQTDDILVAAVGETVEIPVTMSREAAFNAASVYLGYDAGKLEVIGVGSDIPQLASMVKEGEIRIEWYDLTTLHLNEGDVLFTLIARPIAEVNPTDLVFSLDQGTEFIDVRAEVIPDVYVSVSSISTSDATVSITDPDQLGISLEAFPNPFRDELTLNYHIDEPGLVRMTLVNMLGATIANLVDHNHETGGYTYQLNPGAMTLEYGVYFVRMEVQGESRLYNTHVKLIYMK